MIDYFRKIPAISTYIGYHIEGDDGSDEQRSAAITKLSDETLVDHRPLFLCNNLKEWFPLHFPVEVMKTFRVLEVWFRIPDDKIKIYHSFKEYHSLFSYSSIDGSYILCDKMLDHIRDGIDLFVLDSNNDKNELSEAILIHPKKYVCGINEIPFDIRQLLTE